MKDFEIVEYDDASDQERNEGCLCEKEGESGVELHLYHSNLSSLEKIETFNPKLTVLTLIGQPLETLEGVEHLVHLKELWAVECQLKDVSVVEDCSCLEKLYLYSNSINEIPKLTKLTKLKVLWLAGNNIKQLKYIDCPKELTELNVANNQIKNLGQILIHCKELQILNLSANPFYQLKDIYIIENVPNLLSLLLGDPIYGGSPVVKLCNYRMFMVFHMSQLSILDHQEITPAEKLRAKAFYNEKMQFYSMQSCNLLSSCHRTMIDYLKKHNEMLSTYKRCYYSYILKQKKMIPSKKEKTQAEKQLDLQIEHVQVKVQNGTLILNEWLKHHEQSIKAKIHHMNLELQTAGNLTFTSHEDGSKLLLVCQKLLDKYSCFHLYRKLGILGAKALRVTHVYNKGLDLMIQDEKNISKKECPNTIRMLVSPGGVTDSSTWPFNIIEEGFPNQGAHEVLITDCLYCADAKWITDKRNKCKYISRYIQIPKEDQNARRMAILVQFPVSLVLIRQENHESTYPPDLSVPKKPAKSCKAYCKKAAANKTFPPVAKECNVHSVSNPCSIIPAYILEFQYVYEDKLETFRQNMGWSYDIHDSVVEEVDNLCPLLTPAALTKVLGCNTFDNLTTLKLMGHGIQSLDNMPVMDNIISVDLSYNKLSSLSFLYIFPNVTTLDISFNFISNLETHIECLLLNELNMSWNSIGKLFCSLKYMYQICPSLISLDVRNNPIEDLIDISHIANFAHLYLRNLVTLNGMQMDELIQQSETSKYACGKIDNTIPRPAVTLYWKAELCHELQGDCYVDKPDWIFCKGQKIINVHTTDFTELKWADFSYNLLQNLDFLNTCDELVELSLSHNLLRRLNNAVIDLKNLVKLDLSYNYLTSLNIFTTGSFPVLNMLDVSGNMLADLSGVEACQQLKECYASNNKISSFEGLSYLKKCHFLCVLEVSGNSIENNSVFFNTAVFYLHKLEFLNGNAIKESDVQDANAMFGGCLDQDYLLRRYKKKELLYLTELTLIECSIHKVALSSEALPLIKSIDMSHNSITSLWGFSSLSTLKKLCLSFNQMSHFRKSTEQPMSLIATPNSSSCKPTDDPSDDSSNRMASCFQQLELIFLDNNEMSTLKDLHLGMMPSLKAVFAQDNNISSLDGLWNVTKLEYLVLDRNNIQNITSEECVCLTNLTDLFLEWNRIKYLFFLKSMKNLQRLYIAQNRINDCTQLRHLTSLKHLEELTVLGNPFTSRNHHYRLIAHSMPQLKLLDGHNVDPNKNPLYDTMMKSGPPKGLYNELLKGE